MINYDEMEQVIVSLKEYVARMQKISQSQELLSKSVDELENLKQEVQLSAEKVGQHTEQIIKMENDHSAITAQFDRIMEDYRKLHSAFELIDIELKKIDESIHSVSNTIDVKTQKINDIVALIEKLLKQEKENYDILCETQRSVNITKKRQRTFHIVFAIVSAVEVVGLLLAILLK